MQDDTLKNPTLSISDIIPIYFKGERGQVWPFPMYHQPKCSQHWAQRLLVAELLHKLPNWLTQCLNPVLEHICLVGCSKPSLLHLKCRLPGPERQLLIKGTFGFWIWETPRPESSWQSRAADPTQQPCETWFELGVSASFPPHGFATCEFLLCVSCQNKPQLPKQSLVRTVKSPTGFSLKYHPELLIWCDFNARGYLKPISCTSKVGQSSFSRGVFRKAEVMPQFLLKHWIVFELLITSLQVLAGLIASILQGFSWT